MTCYVTDWCVVLRIAKYNDLDKAVEILLAVESADCNAKNLQKTQLPAVNTLSPQAKPHFKTPPEASGATHAQEL